MTCLLVRVNDPDVLLCYDSIRRYWSDLHHQVFLANKECRYHGFNVYFCNTLTRHVCNVKQTQKRHCSDSIVSEHLSIVYLATKLKNLIDNRTFFSRYRHHTSLPLVISARAALIFPRRFHSVKPLPFIFVYIFGWRISFYLGPLRYWSRPFLLCELEAFIWFVNPSIYMRSGRSFGLCSLANSLNCDNW